MTLRALNDRVLMVVAKDAIVLRENAFEKSENENGAREMLRRLILGEFIITVEGVG